MRWRRHGRVVALGAVVVAAGLGATAAAQAPAGPFQVVATTKVGPQPGKVT